MQRSRDHLGPLRLSCRCSSLVGFLSSGLNKKLLRAVMYTPVDSPYVSHADGLAIHTAYIEKVRAYTLSRLDVRGLRGRSC